MSIPPGGISSVSPAPDVSSSPRENKSKQADKRLPEIILNSMKAQIDTKNEGQNSCHFSDMELVLTSDIGELLNAVGRESPDQIDARFKQLHGFIK